MPLRLGAAKEWAVSPQGQLLLLHLANQLPRMGPGFRRIRLSTELTVPLHTDMKRLYGHTTLSEALLQRMRTTVPGEYFLDGTGTGVGSRAPEVRLWVGQPWDGPSADDVAVTTDDWMVAVSVGDPLGYGGARSGSAAHFNPISAQWAAASVCALLYQRCCMGTNPTGAYRWSCWAASVPAPRVQSIELGDLVLVGCGALGNALLEVLRTWPGIRGRLTVYDPDAADETNLNRYLLLDRYLVGQPKVELARAALRGVPGLVLRAHDRDMTDQELAMARRVVLAVDRIEPRLRVQTCWPEFLIEAGTGREYFHVSHCHRTLVVNGQAGCQGCIHGKGGEPPREEREATSVFVAALTGAVLARELLVTLVAGLEAAQDANRVDGNAFEPWSVELTKYPPDPGCEVCGRARGLRRADQTPEGANDERLVMGGSGRAPAQGAGPAGSDAG